MARQDIVLGLEIVAQRLPYLRLPTRIHAQHYPCSSRVLGCFHWLTNTLLLNRRYLGELSEAQALDLLDTIIHEILHKNSSLLCQLKDSFCAHPDIYAEAARLCALLGDDFLQRRREMASCSTTSMPILPPTCRFVTRLVFK